jgi:hypothetical protein
MSFYQNDLGFRVDSPPHTCERKMAACLDVLHSDSLLCSRCLDDMCFIHYHYAGARKSVKSKMPCSREDQLT